MLTAFRHIPHQRGSQPLAGRERKPIVENAVTAEVLKLVRLFFPPRPRLSLASQLLSGGLVCSGASLNYLAPSAMSRFNVTRSPLISTRPELIRSWPLQS